MNHGSLVFSTYKINAKCTYYVIKYNDKEDAGVCKIDDQCKFDAWSRALKASTLGQPQPEVWGGEGGGRGRSGWEDTCTPVADSCWCTAKTTTIL